MWVGVGVCQALEHAGANPRRKLPGFLDVPTPFVSTRGSSLRDNARDNC
jgi:hypothetical protein